MFVALLAVALLGSVVPDARVKLPGGRTVNLSEAVRERPVVLTVDDTATNVPDGVGVVVATGPLAWLGGHKAALIDVGRVVRRLGHPLPVAEWLRGRAIYAAQCLLCHGPDGRESGLSDNQALNGIGNRLTEAEILERTIRSGSVDLTALDQEARRALMIWVAGL